MSTVSEGDSGKRGLEDHSAAQREETLARQRAILRGQLSKMKLKRIDYYTEGRALEWAMGVATLISGIQVLYWKKLGAFHWLIEFMPIDVLGLSMLTIGWARLCGLMLNGQKIGFITLGPFVRAGCGVLSAVLWSQFVMALAQYSWNQGFPSMGLPFWVMFTIAELYVAYTTVKNA